MASGASIVERPGRTSPTSLRAHLAGREHIIMTQWGPWDHEAPLLRRVEARAGLHRYELRKSQPIRSIKPTARMKEPHFVTVTHEPSQSGDTQNIMIKATGDGAFPYDFEIATKN